MKVSEHKLRRKGWAEEEIRRVKEIIEHAERNKHPAIWFLERFVYWFGLLVTMAGTFLFSLILIPLILGAPEQMIYLIVITFGLVLGALFVMIIKDIEHIKTGHHVFHGIVIPVTAIINLSLMIKIANGLVSITKLGTAQSYVGINVAYIASLIIPYMINLIITRKKEVAHGTIGVEH